jgi:teichuronic acid biosynthesis glycosyltransferase TuaG
MPLVSVITPIYNAARWLPEAIASVQAQTLTDWEHILVDDGSEDDSVAIVERAMAGDARLRLLRMPRNGGPAAARNLALSNTQGRFIAFLDADDLWRPEKLHRCVEFMKVHRREFIYHDFCYFSSENRCLGPVVAGPKVLTFRNLHVYRGIHTCAVVIDRKILPDFRFPVTPYRHEDLIAWLSLVKQNKFGQRMPENLGFARLSEESRNAGKLGAAVQVWRIYRNVSGLSPMLTAYWWLLYVWNSWRLLRASRPSTATIAAMYGCK